MNKDKYVISQLTSFLNRSLFNDYVRKYHGDKSLTSSNSKATSTRSTRPPSTCASTCSSGQGSEPRRVRSKGNLKYKAVRWKRRLPKGVLSDAEIELTGYYPSKYYPKRLRLIRYWDEEQGREFMFLTNAIGLPALLVAELYKNRWQIELFFKWLKQHLRIKKFQGLPRPGKRRQGARCQDHLGVQGAADKEITL